MNLKYYLLLTLLGLFVYWLMSPSKIENSLNMQVPASAEVSAVREEGALTESPKPSAEVTAINDSKPLTSESQESHLKENFIGFLNMVNKCLDIKNSIDESITEPNVENILSSVQNELGEPVIRSEDWTSTEIELSNGQKKMIKVETSYENDDLVRSLKYFQMTNQGLIPIELSKDQTTDPSPTLLASLEGEGRITKKEKSERIFFQNGEEILYTEMNSKVDFIEMTKGGKTLRCKDLNKSPCVCQ